MYCIVTTTVIMLLPVLKLAHYWLCPISPPVYVDALSQRSLLLALQWSTFNYQPGDLLFLFSGNLDLYTKVK